MLSATGRSRPGLRAVGTRNRTEPSRRADNQMCSDAAPDPGIPYAALSPCRAIRALTDPSRSAQRSTLSASWATPPAAPGPAGQEKKQQQQRLIALTDHGLGTALSLVRAPRPLGGAARAWPSRPRLPRARGTGPEQSPSRLLRR